MGLGGILTPFTLSALLLHPFLLTFASNPNFPAISSMTRQRFPLSVVLGMKPKTAHNLIPRFNIPRGNLTYQNLILPYWEVSYLLKHRQSPTKPEDLNRALLRKKVQGFEEIVGRSFHNDGKGKEPLEHDFGEEGLSRDNENDAKLFILEGFPEAPEGSGNGPVVFYPAYDDDFLDQHRTPQGKDFEKLSRKELAALLGKWGVPDGIYPIGIIAPAGDNENEPDPEQPVEVLYTMNPAKMALDAGADLDPDLSYSVGLGGSMKAKKVMKRDTLSLTEEGEEAIERVIGDRQSQRGLFGSVKYSSPALLPYDLRGNYNPDENPFQLLRQLLRKHKGRNRDLLKDRRRDDAVNENGNPGTMYFRGVVPRSDHSGTPPSDDGRRFQTQGW